MVRWGLFFLRATFFFSGRVTLRVTGKGTDSPFSLSPLCPFSTKITDNSIYLLISRLINILYLVLRVVASD